MPAVQDRPLTKEEYPQLFRTMLKSALNILKGETERTGKFTGNAAAVALVSQLTAWAYNREPFRSTTWTSAMNPLDYWKAVAKDSNASVLGVINSSLYFFLTLNMLMFYFQIVAIKVFSIMPSEICDERTASRLGWFNSARRSSMTADDLVDCAKLYDYYTYGYTDKPPAFSRPHAFVHVPEASQTPTATSAVRSAPTLLDLLHDTNMDMAAPTTTADHEALEELWFNPTDPYDLEEADRCALDVPAVVRSTERFKIADYVKLESTSLATLIEAHGNVAGTGEAMVVDDAADAGGPGWNISDFL
jgi:hypothetical protein